MKNAQNSSVKKKKTKQKKNKQTKKQKTSNNPTGKQAKDMTEVFYRKDIQMENKQMKLYSIPLTTMKM